MSLDAAIGNLASAQTDISSACQTFLANYSIAARVPYYPSGSSALQSTPEDELDSPFVASSVVAVHGGIHPSWADVSRINEVGVRFVNRLVNPKLPGQLYLPRDTPDDEKDLYSATGAEFRCYLTFSLDRALLTLPDACACCLAFAFRPAVVSRLCARR